MINVVRLRKKNKKSSGFVWLGSMIIDKFTLYFHTLLYI